MIKPLFQRILVAYHGSQSSLRAVMYGIVMVKMYKCELKVVSVVDTATIKYLTLSKFMVADESEKLKSNLEIDAQRNFDYVKKLAKSKGVKIETELRYGAIWAEVLSVADESKSNLILLGSYTNADKDSTLNRDIHSKHNNEIMSEAKCNVMIVNEAHIEQLFKLA